MAHRLVLDSAAALIQLLVGQTDHVERVGDLDGVGEHGVEHRPIRPGQIQGGPARCSLATPRCGQPASGTARASLYQARRPAARPASTSTIDVDHRWRRRGPSRTNSVSSRPEGGGLRRCGRGPRPARCRRRRRRHSRCASRSPARRPPRSRCVPSGPPVRSPTGRPDRSAPAGAPRWPGSSPVHDPTGHAPWRHRQRCLRHTSRARRPNTGRSTSSTSGRSFTSATVPQPRHIGRGRRDSTWIRNGRAGSSTTPSTFTSGRPTSSSHMRVGLISTGALRIVRRQNPPILRAPVPRLVDPASTATPAQIQKSLFAEGADVTGVARHLEVSELQTYYRWRNHTWVRPQCSRPVP